MSPTLRHLVPALALLAASTACDRNDASDGAAGGQIDSAEVASSAAEAVAATLRATGLSNADVKRRWILAPGPTPWDTLLANELRRAEPAIAEEVEDSTAVATVSTYGFSARGDTVHVTIVVRSCLKSDTLFNFTRDSLVHRLVRSGDGGEWRADGPVTHDHAVGECHPTPEPASAPTNG